MYSVYGASLSLRAKNMDEKQNDINPFVFPLGRHQAINKVNISYLASWRRLSCLPASRQPFHKVSVTCLQSLPGTKPGS